MGLADLVEVANAYTGIMVAFLWLAGGIGFRLLKNEIEDNGSEIETLHEEHAETMQDLQRVDQKQDHIVSRQEMVLERMGMNEQEIQELREDTARLDERHQQGDSPFYRGGSNSQADPGGG